MNRTEARQLLADYVSTGAESSFRELVDANFDLVYSTALRLVGRDSHLAEDVTQNVFVDLARQAGKLSSDATLGGWLHRHTCFVAANTARAERRRQSRERQAAEMHAVAAPSDGRMDQFAPFLDEAVNQLDADDHAAILLRFYEKRAYRSVGKAIGSSEDAARMRVNRALEKLRSILQRRGVALSATALAATLSTEAITAAPSGLASAIAGTALATAAIESSTILMKFTTMTKLKLALVGALVAASGTGLLVEHQKQNWLREANELFRQQAGQLATDNESLSNALAHARAAPADDQRLELLRLRSEVGVLKLQMMEAAKLQVQTTRPVTSPPTEPPAGEKQLVIQRAIGNAKMRYANTWMKAFDSYSARNEGRIPATFDQAAAFLDNTNDLEIVSATNLFEFAYTGTLAGIANPATAIILRESEPVQGVDGEWARTYGFADGHSELHVTQDGNFQDFEAQHTAAPQTAANNNP